MPINLPSNTPSNWPERRAAIKAIAEAISAKGQAEQRMLTPAEQETWDDAIHAIEQGDRQEQRDSAAAGHRKELGLVDGGREARFYTGAEHVYRPDRDTSFFGDLAAAKRGDGAAADRLRRNNEARALSTTANAGGQFAPPAWLVDEYIPLAAPGRVTADLCHHEPLPEGASSVNVPAIATGTSAAVQSTQNTSVSMTDLTTTSVSSNIATIAGQQQVSLQLLAQSPIAYDRVVFGDLNRAYAIALDGQVIAGTGSSGQLLGLTAVSGITAQTYTQASPTVTGAGQFFSQILQAANAIATNRLAPATVIVMHPRRWSWVLNALDTQNRPLVVPNGPSFNQLAQTDGGPAVAGVGPAGTLLGLPVYVDPNIPTNLGAGTNQDEVFVMKADDLWLFESQLTFSSHDATYANQLTMLYRVYGYAAMTARYAKSISVVSGTGLVSPSF